MSWIYIKSADGYNDREIVGYDNPLPVLDSTTRDIPVPVFAALTRPADTTQYAAGDTVAQSTTAADCSQLVFEGSVREAGKGGWIINAFLADSAAQATKGSFELWLFNQPFSAMDGDNAVFTPTDADVTHLVAIIPFDTVYVGDATSGVGGNCVFPKYGLNIRYKCIDTQLYGVLVVRSTYTPISAEQFTVTLLLDEN